MLRPLLLLATRSDGSSSLETIFGAHLAASSDLHRVVPIHYDSILQVEECLDNLTHDELLDTMLVFDLASHKIDPWAVAQFQRDTGEVGAIALAYPEVYCVVYGAQPDHLHNIPAEHHFDLSQLGGLLQAIARHSDGFRAWFDPTHLRAHLKHGMWNDPENPSVYKNLAASRLEVIAAVAEDEKSFLFLEAYAAYRFGYAVSLLSTEKEFLGYVKLIDGAVSPSPPKCDLLITDWELTYADHKGERQFELVKKIDLAHLGMVLVITSLDREELELWMSSKRNVYALDKPIGGIHSFLLPSAAEPVRARKLQAYRSPLLSNLGDARTSKSHDAPFISVRIAHQLMRRARSLYRQGVESVESAVHLALLAGEAKEILGGLSRTLSFEAVSLQNVAETQAEALFFGTSRDPQVVRDRVALLDEEVRQIGRTRTSERLSAAERNCVLRTIQIMRKAYSDSEHFEAAEECLRKYSKYENVALPMRVFYRYCDRVTDSGTSAGRLLLVNAAIVLVFAGIFFLLIQHYCPSSQTSFRVGHALTHSFFSFVEVSPGPAEWDSPHLGPCSATIPPWYFYPIEFAELALAYLHLGLLISLLYRKITRRSP